MDHVKHKCVTTHTNSHEPSTNPSMHEQERAMWYTHESCHVSINESRHTRTHMNHAPIHPATRACHAAAGVPGGVCEILRNSQKSYLYS